MKNKIDNFLNFLIEENISGKLRIYYSEKLREIFKEIKFRDPGNIVSILLDIEDKDEYLDSYTLVDVTDKNDFISFIQVNRIIRGEGWSNTNHPNELDSKFLNKENDYWKRARTEIGLGRWANRVIGEVYNKQVLSSQISRLVDFYRSIFDEENVDLFEVVSGDKIKKWYLEDNYERNIGQLGNSCMKDLNCQSYFDIYTMNPEVCKLLILYSDTTKTKIIGRSLLWELKSGKKYQDRIYTNYDSDMFSIMNWGETKGYITYPNLDGLEYVQVKPKDYGQYPYMDTFIVYNRETGLLSNDEDLWPNNGYIKLQQTNGKYISDEVFWSEYNGEFINEQDAIKAITKDGEDYFYISQVVYINGKYYSEDLTKWSSTHNRSLLISDSVWSNILKDVLDPKNSGVIKIYKDETMKNYDWTILDMEGTWVKDGDKYYHPEYYILDPFTNKMIFIDKADDDLRFKIKKALNINSNKDMLEIVREVYESNDYNLEYLINFIKNSSIYKERIIGRYWGLGRESLSIRPEDLILGALVHPIGDTNNGFIDLSTSINKEIGNKYALFNTTSMWLTEEIKKLFNTIDYSKVSNKLYMLNLFNRKLIF